MERNLKIFLGSYFLFLLITAPFIFPYSDTFNYWMWGNHLALSYFDGPPMIAYLLRFSDFLFGTNFFGLSIVGITCGAALCYCIYKMGVLLRDVKTGLLAASLWVVTPLITQNFFMSVTYDAPENLFAATTIYFTMCYLLRSQAKFLYLMGLSAGLLLLSKYTGAALLAAIVFYFAWNRDARAVFKNPHFYGAGILCLLVFSPVIVWNIQNHFASFLFQLTTHNLDTVSFKQHLLSLLVFAGSALAYLNILLLLPIWVFCLKRPKEPRSKMTHFLLTIGCVLVAFWFVMAYANDIYARYYMEAVSVFVLLTSDILLRYQYDKTLKGLLAASLFISIITILTHTLWLNPMIYNTYPVYTAAKNTLLEAKEQGATQVVSASWPNTSQLNFIAKQLSMPEVANWARNGVYRYWPFPLNLDPDTKTLYIEINKDDNGPDSLSLIQEVFKHCTPLQTTSYNHKQLITHRILKSNLINSHCN